MAHLNNQNLAAFTKDSSISPVNQIPGIGHLLKEGRTFLGYPAALHIFSCVATQYTRPRLRILTQLPFDRQGPPRMAC